MDLNEWINVLKTTNHPHLEVTQLDLHLSKQAENGSGNVFYKSRKTKEIPCTQNRRHSGEHKGWILTNFPVLLQHPTPYTHTPNCFIGFPDSQEWIFDGLTGSTRRGRKSLMCGTLPIGLKSSPIKRFIVLDTTFQNIWPKCNGLLGSNVYLNQFCN